MSHAAPPSGLGAQQGAADRPLAAARWLAVLFTGLQFALYVPPVGTVIPFPRSVGLAVAAPLVLLNLVELAAGARLRARWPSAWPLAQLCVDCAVALAVVWLFSFDAVSALWALLALPVLQAALRFQLRGALLAWAALSCGYVLRELWAAARYESVVFLPDSITYRLGILGIVAAATGSLARQLAVRLEEVGGLRAVAAATSRMTGRDADKVLGEVDAATASVGFPARRVVWADASARPLWAAPLVQRAGAGPVGGPVVSPFVMARAQAPGAPPDLGATLLAVPVLTGGELVALVVVGCPGPVPEHRLQALEVLAAHAGAALAHASRDRDRRRFEQQLAHQATHDALTGLPNRVLLQERTTAALRAAARTGTSTAVLLLDLDRFKDINDTLGHAYGDALLVEVAARLSATLRGTDTAARLGGDEFAVLAAVELADGTAGGTGEAACALARRVLAAVQEPVRLDGLVVDVAVSIGVAVAPGHGTDVEDLLRCADIAMYTAKATGLGVAEYDPDQDSHSLERLALLGELRRALDDGDELVLHYQPEVDAFTGELACMEALLRWDHPVRGLVPPGAFLPAAEGTGLIHGLTSYVLRAALAQARAWQLAGARVPVAVNLSARCLLDAGLPDQVARLLADAGVPAQLLRLEITESAVMADPVRSGAVLRRLADQGVRLSLDDFGTGYSSMGWLQQLPVDELKVDRSFVSDMCTSPGDAVLVRSLIELGHSLGLHVVAEGVEDEATLQALRDLGCDTVQGFHLARPAPASELGDWLPARRLAAPQRS